MTERVCGNQGCDGDMAAKRRDAVYCSRACKTAASDARRIADGRAQQRDRARYADEAEHRRAYARDYLAANPERMRAIRRNRKQRIKAERCLVTTRDWLRLVARYRGCCAYCEEKPERLIREHVVPLARGGRHSIGNILPACDRCNARKRTKFLVEWRAEQRLEVNPNPIPEFEAPGRLPRRLRRLAGHPGKPRPDVAA